MKRIAWSSDLKTTANEKTGEIRYFMKCCDYWKRVSRDTYLSREADSDRSDCHLTQIRNGVIHQYKTVYGTYLTAKQVNGLPT